ncbi:class I SAM-dependent methyltransferase [bacterium]|nr:MAG: class I SAM-dependent methyltransferase [bacterium]
MSCVFRGLRRFLVKLTPKILPNRNRFYIDFTLQNISHFLTSKTNNILDIGGSSGHQAYALKSSLNLRGTKVVTTVLDFDSRALLKGKQLYPELNYVRGDAHYIPFRSGIFDLVYSYSLVEHLRNPWIAIKEQVRISKRCIVLQIPNLYYFVELHTKSPFLCLFPDTIRRRIVETTNPGMWLNFDVTYKALVERFHKSGYRLAISVMIYHVKLAKILLIPQGYMAAFVKEAN